MAFGITPEQYNSKILENLSRDVQHLNSGEPITMRAHVVDEAGQRLFKFEGKKALLPVVLQDLKGAGGKEPEMPPTAASPYLDMGTLYMKSLPIMDKERGPIILDANDAEPFLAYKFETTTVTNPTQIPIPLDGNIDAVMSSAEYLRRATEQFKASKVEAAEVFGARGKPGRGNKR